MFLKVIEQKNLEGISAKSKVLRGLNKLFKKGVRKWHDGKMKQQD